MEQIGIALFGVTAIFLSQVDSPEAKKYASIFGLLSQPFWFYATYTASQWGMFFLCFMYAGAWGMGFYNNWIKCK